MEMSRLKTPIVSVVIGEGGSGGALGLAVADRVAMFQHSFYSVISPEGCAAILWKTADRRQHAAEALRLTAKQLDKLGVVDDVISEPVGGAHRDPNASAASLEKYIVSTLDSLKRLKPETLVRKRQERVRQLGGFFESPAEAKAAAEAAAKKKEATRRSTSRSSRLSSRFTRTSRVES
jgi:acetyl-CoA carboxylase carboxyl transferase subunit alpha